MPGNTVVHKKIAHVKLLVELCSCQVQLQNKFSRDIIVACASVSHATKASIIRVGFRQNGFFADFGFLAAGFFRGFCRRIFSPHFCGKKCPEKSFRKIPGKISKSYTIKIPDTFLQGVRANNYDFVIHFLENHFVARLQSQLHEVFLCESFTQSFCGPLVSKCSATLASVAAPPPGARQGFRGPNYPRHPTGRSGMGCDRALWRGCSCDTPATHSKLRKEPRRGCSYTLELDRGGV